MGQKLQPSQPLVLPLAHPHETDHLSATPNHNDSAPSPLLSQQTDTSKQDGKADKLLAELYKLDPLKIVQILEKFYPTDDNGFLKADHPHQNQLGHEFFPGYSSASAKEKEIKKHLTAGLIRKFVRLSIVPYGGSLEMQLADKFECLRQGVVKLADVNLPESPGQSLGDEAIIMALAPVARSLLHKHLTDRAGEKIVVAVGGGRTIREFCSSLIRRAADDVCFVPTNFLSNSPFHAMLAQWKSGTGLPVSCALPRLPNATSRNDREPLQYHRKLYLGNPAVKEQFVQCLNPDLTFIGVGPLLEKKNSFESEHANHALTEAFRPVGLSLEDISGLRDPEDNSKPIADINLSLISHTGKDMTAAITKRLKITQAIHSSSHPFVVGLSLAHFKTLAQQSEKKVVLVAGGRIEKARAIYAVLKGGYVNSLVTDRITAQTLIDIANREKGQS